MFSWKPIYIEIGRKVLAYRDKQGQLLGWLHEMKDANLPVVSLTDSKSPGKPSQLAGIDPFTFFANFNRGIKNEHRFAILRMLKDKMSLSADLAQDFDGIPVANLQKAWFFPFAHERDPKTIPLLWEFATDVVKHQPSELNSDLFERCLDIKQVGLAKLTMGMFWLAPDRYLALDHVNQAYLADSYSFSTKDLRPEDLKGYLRILDAVRATAIPDFPRLSYDAYTHGLSVNLDLAALSKGFREYLEQLSKEGRYSFEHLVDLIKSPWSSGESEISNRTIHQRALQQALNRTDLTESTLKAITDKLWALGDRRDTIRRNEYFKSEEMMNDVRALLDEASGIPIPIRINDFVDAAHSHGYRPKAGQDLTCPAQFASVLLSSRWPDRFVDFRKERWERLYKGVTQPTSRLLRGKHYGHLLLRAGSFASQLSKTSTFKECFGESSELWTVAAVAWALKDGPPKDRPLNDRPTLKGPKRYWAGGFLFSGKDSKLDEFLAGNYWRHGYSRKSRNPTAKAVWALFEQIKPGDEFAIKGYGGTADLKIKYVGRVKEVVPEEKRVELDTLERPLYEGKGPTGAGAGNWHLTLLEVTRKDVIDMIFGKRTKHPQLPAKNIILYGPPGTGKTYALCNDYMERFTERDTPKSNEQFADELVAEMAWWEVATLVLLDLKTATVSQILEHQVMKARIRRSVTKNVRNAIWAHLQAHTSRQCEHVAYMNRHEPLIFWKSKESVWSIDAALAVAELPDLHEALEKWKNYRPAAGDAIRRYEFTTFHQSYSYEEFVEGIKPVIETEGGGDLTYEVKPGVFRRIAQRAQSDPEHDYAIFIDEINRGNIASIFGELITLLEDDKRLGARFQIKARLPYSREEFGVPSNLYVIGTMNTADRSVEALDAALRRRFWFIPRLPEPALLPDGPLPGLGVDLRAMLTVINERLERLLDRDHCIGHSYLMGVESASEPLDALRQAFANKVLPLLEEYFYGDPGKIGLVLGSAFVEKRQKQREFAKCEWDREVDEDRETFVRADPMQLGVEAYQAIYA